MKKIVFFIQTEKPIGGSQILFLDLASYISKNHKDYETYYINHRNSIVENMYGSSNVNFLDVNECDYSQFEDAVFFAPINYIFYLLVKIKNLKKARICLYFYHPQIFDWLSMQIGKVKVDFEPLLELLMKTNSCCFMDKSNLLSVNRMSRLTFDENYVPVTLHGSDIEQFTKQEYVNNDRINIGWLGRLDRDKVYSIINLADNLSALELDKKIDLHIIGDGNSKRLLPIAKYTPNIRFIFTSYMYGEERDEYIKKHIDIMLAMGISAIDSAIIGIPTIIPIVSPVPYRDDKYIYIFNSKGYSLGCDINDLKDLECKYNYLNDILDDIYNKNMKQEIGEKSYSFVRSTFDLKKGTDLFLESVNKSTLTVEECLKKSSLVSKHLKKFDFYRKLRKRDDFASFHEFNARIKRVRMQKGPVKKIRRIIKELKSTINKDRNDRCEK